MARIPLLPNEGGVLLTLDARRRVTLTGLGHEKHTRYFATTEPGGTIVLRPVALAPACAECPHPADLHGQDGCIANPANCICDWNGVSA